MYTPPPTIATDKLWEAVNNSEPQSIAGVRDLYFSKHQFDAWEHLQKVADEDTMSLLTGEDLEGNAVEKQNIESLLNTLNDLGNYSTNEWILFLTNVREHGI